MKIGYFGDGIWAHNAFKKIVADKSMEIVFVVLRFETQDEVLRKLAAEQEIPVLVHPNINSAEFKQMIMEFKADLFISMSFNQIFKQELIEMPLLKTINCHAGKLPFYRGRNILNWALINDEKEFGITVHYMDTGIDTGDIILQKTFPICDTDTYGTLLKKAHEECADILYEAVQQIAEGTAHIIKQRDIDEIGMYCGAREPGDEMINWNQTSRQIYNFIRALASPGPLATTFVRGQEVKISRAEMISGACKYINTVGQVVGKDGTDLIVKTADTTIKVTEYSCDMKIRIGDRLGV